MSVRGGRYTGVPRPPASVVARPELEALLDRHTQLTTIAAPAGSGKTTLLASWAHDRPDVLWGDADPGADVWDAIADVHEPRVLVIDRAERVDPATAEILLDRLADTPWLRLVVAGRDLRAFQTPRTMMRFDRTDVTTEQLAFTLDQTEAILRAGGVLVDEATSTLLHASGASHAGVLRAAVVELGRRPVTDPAEAVARVARLVADTMIATPDEIAARPGLREFLYDTVVADTLDVSLANQLTGAATAVPMFEAAIELGLGTWVDGYSFAYSGATRLVMRRAARAADPIRYQRCSEIAGRWAAEQGRPISAFRAAIDRADYQAASDEIVRSFAALSASGRLGEVRILLETVPRRALQAHPVLALVLALCYNAVQRRRGKAMEMFATALIGAKVGPARNLPIDQITVRTLESVGLRVIGRPQLGANSARTALAHIDALDAETRSRFAQTLPVALSHNSLTLLYAGHYDEALAAFERTYAALPVHHERALFVLGAVAAARALHGDMRGAATAVALVQTRELPPSIAAYVNTLLFLGEALIALERGDAIAAHATLEAQLEVEVATSEHWELITHVLGTLDVFVGRPDIAVERVEAERARHRGRHTSAPYVAGLLTATRATAELAAGSPLEALATVHAVRRPTVPVHLAAARAELAARRPDAALAALDRAARLGLGSVRRRAEAAVIEAAARRQLAPDGATREAAASLAILDVHGLRSPLALLPADDLAAVLAAADDPAAATRPASVLRPAAVVHLTPREQAVMARLTETGSASEIAQALFVSVDTVKSHLRSIYRKLGVNSRDEALARAPSALRRDADA